MPQEILAGLLRDQLEAFSVLADRISLVRRGVDSGRASIEEVEEAEDTVRWLRRLTRGILGAFDLEGDEEGRSADVAAAARRAVRRWARAMPNVEVSVDVERGTWVRASPTVVERVLECLMASAGRRARRGVRLVASRSGNEVRLRVEDDGPARGEAPPADGLRPDADAELDALRWLVERAGGSITAGASREPGGRSIRVRLPAGLPPDGPAGGNPE